MLNFLGLLLAVGVAVYTFLYAFHLWRSEKNLPGTLVLVGLGVACLALPVYVLYFRG